MGLGRLLIVGGVILILAGIFLVAAEKVHLPLGRLPGDIVFRGKNTSVYVPIVTCLLLSALGTFLLWLINRR